MDHIWFEPLTCAPKKHDIELYSKVLINKLFPFLKDFESDVEEEAEKSAHMFNPETDAAEYYENRCFIELNLYNTLGYIAFLGVAGLYHLWERQVIEFLHNELRFSICFRNKSINKFSDIDKIFKAYSTNLNSFDFSKDLTELRLLANVVKHGGGASLQKLKDMTNNSLFSHMPDKFTFSSYFFLSDTGVTLYLDEETINRYSNALISFWDASLWQKRGDRRYPTSVIT
jgi:glycosyltransferase involved in cell wall biosynthesis